MRSDKVLGLIAARGGSKGLPRKNVLLAGGKPLIAWTIQAAAESSVVDRVVLSSDDDEIIETAKQWGCTVPFRRPNELAVDAATSMSVVLHALKNLPDFEYVILLQPTSPMRTAADIDAAFEQLKRTGAPSCVSVSEVDKSPYWMYELTSEGRLSSLLPHQPLASRRQDLKPIYALNGAIYIARVEWLLSSKQFVTLETVAYVMSAHASIDIDTREDFEIFCSRLNATKSTGTS